MASGPDPEVEAPGAGEAPPPAGNPQASTEPETGTGSGDADGGPDGEFEGTWYSHPVRVVEARVIRAEDEEPIAGASVVAMPDGHSGRTLVTDARGLVRFTDLPGPSVDVVARADGRIRELATVADGDWGGRGEWDNGALLFRMRRGVALRGKVLARSTGHPIPGASVTAILGGKVGDDYEPAGSDDELGTCRSGADGSFHTPAVPTVAIVSLLVEHPDFRPAARSFRTRRLSDPHGAVTIELEDATSFSGTVLGLNGDPREGAEVWVVPLTPLEDDDPLRFLDYPGVGRPSDALDRPIGRSALSDEEGRWRVDGVEPDIDVAVFARVLGEESLHFTPPGEWLERSPATFTRSGSAGSVPTLDFHLEPLSYVTMVAVGVEGARPRGELQPLDEKWPPVEANHFAIFDDPPELGFESVRPGRYRLVVEGDGFLPKEVEVLIPRTRSHEIRLEVERGKEIAGVIVYDDDWPASGADILVMKATAKSGGSRDRTARTAADARGRFRIGGFQDGQSMSLIVHAPEGGMATLDDIRAPVEDLRVVVTRTATVTATLTVDEGAEPPAKVDLMAEVIDPERTEQTLWTMAPVQDGRVTFTDLAAHRYAMTLSAEGYESHERIVSLRPGETFDLGTLRFVKETE